LPPVKRFGTEVPCRLEERACRIASVRLEDFPRSYTIERISMGPMRHTLQGKQLPTPVLIVSLLLVAMFELGVFMGICENDFLQTFFAGIGFFGWCILVAMALLKRAVPKNGKPQIPHSFTGGKER